MSFPRFGSGRFGALGAFSEATVRFSTVDFHGTEVVGKLKWDFFVTSRMDQLKKGGLIFWRKFEKVCKFTLMFCFFFVGGDFFK